MLLRSLVFRSLLLPYNRRSTSPSSLSTILHVIDLKTPVTNNQEKQVKMNKTNDISSDNVNTTRVQRRRVNVDGVWKHLGIQHRPNASAAASNNGILKNPTSELSISCSETAESTSVRDIEHEKKCSISSVNSGDSSSREKSLEENEFVTDIECEGMLEECSLPTSFGKSEPSQSKTQKLIKYGLKNGAHTHIRSNGIEVFDICLSEAEVDGFWDEAEERMDGLSMDCVEQEPAQIVLRPGMILLKNYISFSEQVSIVQKCRELGIGPGGFYRPGYKDGAKLRLHMMCLGRDWDPQSRKYRKRRRIDNCKPPDIPFEFRSLVEKAMLDSFKVIRRDSKVSNVEDILPQMNPDICIINFYSETGRLGLHQDRDESPESLAKGIPVVSFSLGDSAEFLYGDHRNPNMAENLILNSGDVLIFGGQSRHVFHGVSSIIPNSAPCSLLEETGLRPGRLNLTFRQY